jgi:hypothetical protein
VTSSSSRCVLQHDPVAQEPAQQLQRAGSDLEEVFGGLHHVPVDLEVPVDPTLFFGEELDELISEALLALAEAQLEVREDVAVDRIRIELDELHSVGQPDLIQGLPEPVTVGKLSDVVHPDVEAVATLLHWAHAAAQGRRRLEDRDGMIGSGDLERSRHSADAASNDNDVDVHHRSLDRTATSRLRSHAHAG